MALVGLGTCGAALAVYGASRLVTPAAATATATATATAIATGQKPQGGKYLGGVAHTHPHPGLESADDAEGEGGEETLVLEPLPGGSHSSGSSSGSSAITRAVHDGPQQQQAGQQQMVKMSARRQAA